ncbi:hypothetical protein [Diaphorobacter ruginosibacter]|uniref:hypothetical protein n=1 Tax=Diaphorobacter ruginosibacter TaxID=1715720 RepID=UPI00333E738D
MARKNIRMERRESLYMVVRDAMVRAGVLSAGYKFKVLSLDPLGQQFVVMVDLAREYGPSTARLSEIETLIVQSAKARFEILVTAVYWRVHDSVGAGVHMRRAADKQALAATRSDAPQTLRAPIMPAGSYEARSSGSVPLRNSGSVPLNSGAVPLNSGAVPLGSGSVPLSSAPAPLIGNHPVVNGHANGRFDPIEDDEVAAFKRALNDARAGAANRNGAPSASARPGTVVRSGPISRSPLLQPSGFGDTEMSAPDSASSDLSATQYGDLN